MSYYNHAEFNRTHPRSEIDDEERRLIDEAVAAGEVKKIPQGKTTLTEDYIWEEPKGPKGVGRLAPVIKLSQAERRERYKRQFGRQQRVNPEVTHRRNEVLRLTREGFSMPVIAEYLGCSEGKVNNDRKYWRRKDQLPALIPGGNGVSVVEMEERREKVLALIKAGKSNQETADILGETIGVVRRDRAALIKAERLPKAVGGRL